MRSHPSGFGREMVSIVENRSTVYCYTSLYAGYSCSLSTFKSQSSCLKWRHFIIWCFWSNRLVSITYKNYYIHKYSYRLCNHCSWVFNKYWYIFTGFVGCCSVENLNNVVENAIVSCPGNSWCKVTCYRGYIFRTGREVQSFGCQDGKWTPLLSSCKRTYIFVLQ